MSASRQIPIPAAPRVDLHCHSCASTEAGEAVLNAINCPESYSQPADVYAQARQRGMAFVTITDHDCIDGVQKLAGLADVVSGEELTCYFPEDGCKIHLLVWGIGRADHDALQAAARDIHKVAAYVEAQQIAHAVAHPLYRQNDLLDRWHLERLFLLFKGFECLNGSHSALHRESLEPMLQDLTPQAIETLAATHKLRPHWPEPWVKSRTGGSDDHGLLNVGQTWTEFPPHVRSVGDVLTCLRHGWCRPGGEAGSAVKLAHNVYGVGIRYYQRELCTPGSKPTLTGAVLGSLVGERQRMRRRDLVRIAAGMKLKGLARRLVRPWAARREPAGTELLTGLFLQSCQQRLAQQQALGRAIQQGQAALAEHDAVFRLICDVSRDVTQGVAAVVARAVEKGNVGAIFDSVSAVTAHQFLLMPYYFSLFHQNRERQILGGLTGHQRRPTAQTLRVGLFTDTFDEINGVARLVQEMGRQASQRGYAFSVATCSDKPRLSPPCRTNFISLLSQPLPQYPELSLTVPPLAEILEWADRQQFDAIHVDTPGPMGLCGWLVARMLRVPLLGTYHTDLPAYVMNLTADHRLSSAARGYVRWFYGQMHTIFSRSRQYQRSLQEIGLAPERLAISAPCVDTERFNPRHRDVDLWFRLGVRQPNRLLYCGRLSLEKNLPLLVTVFRKLCALRSDVALVVAGDGPYGSTMRQELAGLPAHFLGYQNDRQLGPLYASSDLFVFPSCTDTLGQVILEAQASGLPVLVADQGGPQEVMDDGVTGLVLPGSDAARWTKAIDDLLRDEPRRQRMARTGPHRMARYSVAHAFDSFWEEHLRACGQPRRDDQGQHAELVPRQPLGSGAPV